MDIVHPGDQTSADLADATHCVDLGQIDHEVILPQADLKPTSMLGQ